MKCKVFRIPVQIKPKEIESLLISAFEGGSNYWYRIESRGRNFTDRAFTSTGIKISDFYAHDSANKMRVETLNAARLRLGLACMAEKSPKHFADILSDNADAETGDVFLQCCLFGEVIYG